MMVEKSAEASGRKYYWYKMHKDFFTYPTIRFLLAQDDGAACVVFYLKLLMAGLNSGGRLRFTETMPYDDSLLSISTETSIETVNSALVILREAGLIEYEDDMTIFLPKLKNMVGTQTDVARKKQEQRAKQSKKDKCRTEIEKEIYEESEKEMRWGCVADGTQKVFHKPTIEEVEAYCIKKGYDVNAERFWGYYESIGWMVGSAPMIDWKAAIYRFSLHEDY